MILITLVLARGPGKPDGDTNDRLSLTLSLTAQGHIDLQAFESTPTPWLAAKVNADTPDRPLEVTRIDEHWALQSAGGMDDPALTFEGAVFRPGELVRFERPDRACLLYRVVASENQD